MLLVRKVSSKSNRRLKELRKAASGDELALAEGPKIIGEVLGAGIDIRSVAVAESKLAQFQGLLQSCREAGAELISVSDRLLATVSDVVTNQGIVASVIPKLTSLERLSLPENPLLMVTEGIQDPGNLGSIVRSAAAFGADAMIVLPGCADPFGPKAVRGSAGAVFRLPVVRAGVDDLFNWLRAMEISSVGLDVLGQIPLDKAVLGEACAIIVGSEGTGLTALVKGYVNQLVRIPIHPQVESLNAAGAAAIALFEASRQRACD